MGRWLGTVGVLARQFVFRRALHLSAMPQLPDRAHGDAVDPRADLRLALEPRQRAIDMGEDLGRRIVQIGSRKAHRLSERQHQRLVLLDKPAERLGVALSQLMQTKGSMLASAHDACLPRVSVTAATEGFKIVGISETAPAPPGTNAANRERSRTMIPHMLASAWTTTFMAGFGVAAAAMLVGGMIVLRFQRNRQEFILLKTALERGITQLPQGQPFWLISFRQGVMTFTLGAGLLGIGSAAWVMARSVPVPPAEPAPVVTPATLPAAVEKDGRDRAERGVKIRLEQRSFNPGREQWEQARRQLAAGKAMTGAGIVLLLLGVVRMGFARVEKEQSAELI